ncbi:MAG TPA: radical SAM protein [Kofleriaceae bacterium]|nr:radical SAM protein [Kofleriaceae bacterium]
MSGNRGPRRARAEAFGAIFQLERPRALVFVDRTMARRRGVSAEMAKDLWRDPDADGDLGKTPLSAPLEAHLQLTNHCAVGCKGCYTGASPTPAAGEWGLEQWKRAVDELAAMGVFHLALGGGESATLPWLGDIARHARARGLIPNLTTSGLYGLDALLPIAGLFGQINVSMDGLGQTYAAVRGVDGFSDADAALIKLRKKKREIGINVVVTRKNFADLDALFAYARQRRLNEVELLRFKPSGRGAAAHRTLAPTDAQNRALWPVIAAAVKKHRMRARADCSLTPMIAHHEPDPEMLARLAVYGCTGGDFLVGVKASGQVAACSFAAPPRKRPSAHDLADYWQQDGAFGAFRQWKSTPEPCRSCRYFSLCRGGCKAVSAHLAGDPRAPDPECPRVIDFARAKGDRRSTLLPIVR